MTKNTIQAMIDISFLENEIDGMIFVRARKDQKIQILKQ